LEAYSPANRVRSGRDGITGNNNSGENDWAEAHRVVFCISERSDPSNICTGTGADAKETPAMKAINARNEGLEMPVVKST
jgi:hypothetical protein